jgi:hypothetical protein
MGMSYGYGPTADKQVAEASLKRLQVEAIELTPNDLHEIESAASQITV